MVLAALFFCTWTMWCPGACGPAALAAWKDWLPPCWGGAKPPAGAGTDAPPAPPPRPLFLWRFRPPPPPPPASAAAAASWLWNTAHLTNLREVSSTFVVRRASRSRRSMSERHFRSIGSRAFPTRAATNVATEIGVARLAAQADSLDYAHTARLWVPHPSPLGPGSRPFPPTVRAPTRTLPDPSHLSSFFAKYCR